MTNLNETEKKVLWSLIQATRLNGGDFCYPEDVVEEMDNEITINQLKGYLSQLVQKDLIAICYEYDSQLNAKQKAQEIFPDVDLDAITVLY